MIMVRQSIQVCKHPSWTVFEMLWGRE